jgi:hypothetical protein
MQMLCCIDHPFGHNVRLESTLSRGLVPLAWFLPSPACMRGGAARRFASDWLLHRGIQVEATCCPVARKVTRYQRLAESRSWRAGFFCGIQHGQVVISEATFGSCPSSNALERVA